MPKIPMTEEDLRKMMHRGIENPFRGKDKDGCGLDLVVCKDMEDLRNQVLDYAGKYSSTHDMMPLSHHALFRLRDGDFEVGERVVHLGSLERVDEVRDMVVGVITEKDGSPVIWMKTEKPSDSPESLLFQKLARCWCCGRPFRSYDNVNAVAFHRHDLEYCDVCKIVLADIAVKATDGSETRHARKNLG